MIAEYSRAAKILCLLTVVLTACGKPGTEEANRYYDDFSAIIVPYKDGTERILTETQVLLQKQLDESADLAFSREDSVRRSELLSELETLARTTVNDLDKLGDLRGSDLKHSGVEYVNRSVTAMLGAYRTIEDAIRQAEEPLELETIDSLTEKFSDDLIECNEEFAASQMKFLEDFGLLTH